MKLLITGSAGFIGFSLAKKFLDSSYSVIGVDNINEYYDPKLKINRLKELKKYKKFKFFKADISDYVQLEKYIKSINFQEFLI